MEVLNEYLNNHFKCEDTRENIVEVTENLQEKNRHIRFKNMQLCHLGLHPIHITDARTAAPNQQISAMMSMIHRNGSAQGSKTGRI